MADEQSTHPPLALGTWAWGDSGEAGEGYFGTRLTRGGLEEVAERAHAAGFTLWDTALAYGLGRSETVLGEVLGSYDRSEYQISTKFTPRLAGDGEAPVTDMLEQSLANLGTDHVDLYWIHNHSDVERWTRGLVPLLASGQVRQVGVSNHNLEEIRLAGRILEEAGYGLSAVQNHLSLLHRNSEDSGILDHCLEHGIRFYSYMVLEQGALTGRYGPGAPLPEGSSRAAAYNGMLPQLRELTDELTRVGRHRDASAADVATAWAMAKGTTPIVGVTRPEHVDGLARAVAIELAVDEVERLESLGRAAGVDTRGAWEQEM